MTHPMFEKLNNIFEICGIKPPPDHTTFDHCEPHVEELWYAVKSLLAIEKAARSVVWQVDCSCTPRDYDRCDACVFRAALRLRK